MTKPYQSRHSRNPIHSGTISSLWYIPNLTPLPLPFSILQYIYTSQSIRKSFSWKTALSRTLFYIHLKFAMHVIEKLFYLYYGTVCTVMCCSAIRLYCTFQHYIFPLRIYRNMSFQNHATVSHLAPRPPWAVKTVPSVPLKLSCSQTISSAACLHFVPTAKTSSVARLSNSMFSQLDIHFCATPSPWVLWTG